MKSKFAWLRKVAILGVVLVGLGYGTELFLRAKFGLGSPPIYVADASCGYKAAPSQSLRRFSHVVNYNSLSLRNSKEFSPKPAANVRRIICLGDSVTNGGVMVDDRQTIPAWIERDLNAKKGIQFETACAAVGGWAPANELAFLKEIDAKLSYDYVLIQLNGPDLFQPFAAPDSLNKASYPTQKPPLALVELFQRYLLPQATGSMADSDPGETFGKDETATNAANNRQVIIQIVREARKHGATPMIWYMDGAPKPASRKLDVVRFQAELDLYHLAAVGGIPLLFFSHDPEITRACYRDDIHPNTVGNRVFATHLANAIWRIARRHSAPVQTKRPSRRRR